MEKLKQFFGKVSDYCKKAVQWFMGLPKKAHIIIAVVLTAILVGTGTGLIVSSLNKTPAEPTVSIIDGYVAINGVKTEYEVKGPEHVHTYDDWTLYDESVSDCEKKLYYRFCPGCSGMEWEKGAHEYESNYSFNASLHWKKCKNCEHTSAEEEHIAGEDNLCTTCGVALGATEGLIYELSADGTYASLVAYEGTATRIRIAEEHMGVPVTIIGDNVFKNNGNIKSVIIPDSVEFIGDSAFWSCSRLTSVVIGDSVTSIGDYAFWGCYRLTSVVIGDSVTSIGIDAFSCCNSALYTEYKYGKYVKSGDNPYAVLIDITNENFSTYEMHEDTKIIAYGVFYGCSRLSSITIPDSVTSIGLVAFFDCSRLISVVIPDSVTSIGKEAFAYCSSLTSVVIPDSVTSIGKYAFSNCSSLTDVYYTGTEEEWAAITIDESGNGNDYLLNATIHYNYVPEE